MSRKTKKTVIASNEIKTITFWSAPGSVGRSQLAAATAVELATIGFRTLLIDADVVSPAQLQIFGFGENHLGIASATRLAARAELTEETLNSLLLEYQMPKQKLHILAGLHLVSRWPELGYQPTLDLINFATQNFDYVVIDTSANIERELVDQRTLAERNAVTHAALTAADSIVAICPSDPIGLSRFVWAVQELKQLGHSNKLTTLINRMPATRTKQNQSLETALDRLAGLKVFAYLPDDPALFDRALDESLPINLVPKNSAVKQVLSAFIRSQFLSLETSARRLAKLG